MELNTVVLDRKKTSGIWVDWKDKVRLKIAFASQQEMKKSALKIIKSVGEKIETEFDAKVFAAVNEEKMLAEVVLVDWEGFTLNGKPYPYTVDNAEYLLGNSPELMEFVAAEATKREMYLYEIKEKITKNS